MYATLRSGNRIYSTESAAKVGAFTSQSPESPFGTLWTISRQRLGADLLPRPAIFCLLFSEGDEST